MSQAVAEDGRGCCQNTGEATWPRKGGRGGAETVCGPVDELSDEERG